MSPLKLSSYARGSKYEKIAQDILTQQGFTAFRLSLFARSGSDLQVSPDLQIEVKGSVAHKVNSHRTGYSFCIEKIGHTSVKDSDCLMLVCIGKPHQTFIIPAALVHCNYITIPTEDLSKYHGQWAHYLNAWQLLADMGARRKPVSLITIGV